MAASADIVASTSRRAAVIASGLYTGPLSEVEASLIVMFVAIGFS